ncbi:lipase, putative [Bodo saltans]|uniref:Lipase, putative n=1 Tax=Bodo saltans TaxID=75058 RepID=A0A0S4IJE8_BODSA|nr:lipase, putative [Bodo saltans]|eukprot:CUE81955.1 lipase, putative [Bodo saltans]
MAAVKSPFIVAACLLLVVAVAAATSGAVSSSSSYNPTVALSGWLYGKAVNCNRTSIENWSCETCQNISGMKDVRVFHNETTGGQAYVGFNEVSNTLVVTFRGSVDIQNWINNLDFFFIDYPNSDCTTFNGGSSCQVHRGFLNVYESIKFEGLLSYVNSLWTSVKSKSPSVLVTGHSLGGALAILGGVDVTLLLRDQTSDIHVYTYGEPRVGNPAWAKWVAESVLIGGKQYRLTHESDPVPRLPPLEFGFLHVPHEVWYNNDLAGDHFTVCMDNATAEDYANCENTQYAFDTSDHLKKAVHMFLLPRRQQTCNTNSLFQKKNPTFTFFMF